MLTKAKTLTGYKLDGIDGELGHVKEFYFDDKHWTVRYLVADTGGWLTNRKVLVSPQALRSVEDETHQIHVKLTKHQIENSPSLDTDMPVSRQYEENYYGYYGWPMYWAGPYMWGYYPYPTMDFETAEQHNEEIRAWDPHLRSTHEVDGYAVVATDGEVGHVDDFILDEETWAIRYLVVKTRTWLPGKKFLISPRWIDSVNWADSSVSIKLNRATVEMAEPYMDDTLITREYEATIHRQYDQAVYWDPAENKKATLV